MKGSEASERLKLHDVLTGFSPDPNPSPHADPALTPTQILTLPLATGP